MSEILVVGGAGYIGSHMVKRLRKVGHEVLVLDDLSGGFRPAVLGADLVVGSIADRELLHSLFAARRFAAVMHFASFIQVGESVSDPGKYYANNLGSTLTLLDAMRHAGVLRFIFSSTAAVYGDPSYTPIGEEHPANPINPYGRSKWMLEKILDDYDAAYGLKSVCLRYFNAAGADPEGQLGECHQPETHLIPLVLQAAAGRRPSVAIYGADYDTPDGTCIRDYIHVSDLCGAHLLALQYLLDGKDSARFNLGNGSGFSVRQVMEVVRQVTGRDFTVRQEARRHGDPPRLVADATLAKRVLGWRSERAELETIVADAWNWERKYPWFQS
jgi:UDP-glucose 4-epimerase